jgi:hypothetical protein
MRSSREAVEYCCAQSINRNSFSNDQIEAERVELAQAAKQIGRRFSRVSVIA